MTDPNELRKQSAAFHHESEMSKTLVLAADTIDRLTAELGDLPESQADMLREIKQLKGERDGYRKTAHEWIGCNAPGGWIDNLRKERDVLAKAFSDHQLALAVAKEKS